MSPAHPLAAPLLAGNRRALAKAITLVESHRPEHEREAQALLTELLPHAGHSLRVGLTGVPGVGKSTLIEALGMFLAEAGHKVAVLAVDPSSKRTGGSIMGDKTRMPQLTVHPNAFIRPSPSGGTLGGVARRTRETITLCEAAGYDVLLVETVGVGQSETQVAGMTDLFVLLTLHGAGDELQGIKRGIMEMSDLCVVNKADTDPRAAIRAQTELRSALTLLTPHDAPWRPAALRASAVTGEGIPELWAKIQEYAATVDLAAKRRAQTAVWFDDLLREAVWRAFLAGHDPARLRELRAQVERGEKAAVAAVGEVMAHPTAQPT
ncbi:methylmalonyl Co-A mutase-associated GTPase MeaB [Deinococcus wulumuqiensis]|uniref:ATPase/protein kinase n=1 Tax=Deinococcus wulumuqiensis TaxID=980427 RepID=A0AAV4K805_9DEIO|nr:methylmalonyl Co-A mutase-associated GTPase MeaB [Deinococcus wulumuqiensis]QII19833.1 methylmalonyl Co-A mutase-associated GTPase MeaB [Deinococcus wulumuqiensis R12]GGI89874.1 ATPase/protein kinase [Deinococcus wulumuqiensis]GGP30662.1 ATPase/protein kinase [Deinococcus wulumuqiensis]